MATGNRVAQEEPWAAPMVLGVFAFWLVLGLTLHWSGCF